MCGEGEGAAGPIGAVTGGVDGILIDQRPRFQHYVVEQHHSLFQYRGSVRVGAILLKPALPTIGCPPSTVR